MPFYLYVSFYLKLIRHKLEKSLHDAILLAWFYIINKNEMSSQLLYIQTRIEAGKNYYVLQ